MRILQLTFTVLLATFYSAVIAQEEISLTDADMQRLGIVLATIQASSDENGASIPAQIIHAPAADTTLRAYYSGVLIQWHANSGDSLNVSTQVATIRSQKILELQNDWLGSVLTLEEQKFLLEKDETLFAEGIISRQRMEQTERVFNQANNSELVARQTLLQIGMNDTDLKDLRNGVGLGIYNIRAGQEGALSHQAVITGQFVADNSIIGSVTGTQKWLKASVPARLAVSMRQGQQLRISGNSVPLTLMRIDQEIDPVSQSVDILARFEGSVSFMPGQLITLVIPPLQGGVLIPAESVVHTGDDTLVYVRTANGLEGRPLMLIPLGADFLASSGISAGEEVVVRGAAIVKGIQLGLGGE